MEDTELRSRLEFLASRIAPPEQDADDLVAAVAARSRAGRRRQAFLVAAAAAVVAVLVAVPAVRSELGRDDDPAAPASPTAVYTTPTRGNLSYDVDFLDVMSRRAWRTETGARHVLEPPVDTRRVVYASDYADRRWVLVAGADPTALPPDDGVDPADLDELGSVAIAWFTGPLSAAPEEMRVYGEPRIVEADEPAAVLSPTEPYGSVRVNHVVVVGAPGDQVELSWFREIAPDGDIVRSFERAPTADGVAAVVAGQVDASIDRTVRYRIVRGETEFSGLPETERRPDFVPPRVNPARLRPAPPAAPGDAAVASAIDTVVSHQGIWAHALDFTVLWAGDLPTPAGARLTVLSARFAYGGGFYLTGAVGREVGGRIRSSTCGSETRPEDTPPDDMVAVLRCGSDGGPEDAPTDSLVVVAPPGATTAGALDDRGEQIASYPLVDGVAVVPVPPDLASVVVIGADGETLDERAPMGEVDWGP
jgi:hypothetical protein